MAPPEPSNPPLRRFAELARAFCDLVETADPARGAEILHELHLLLARLYLAALLLPQPFALLTDAPVSRDDPSPPSPKKAVVNVQHRAVALRFAAVFTGCDTYREIFDPYAPMTDPEVCGSLGDDISDIYSHLREGLDHWNARGFGEALFEWRFNFEIHWAEHASGALRALFARSAWYDLGWQQREL